MKDLTGIISYIKKFKLIHYIYLPAPKCGSFRQASHIDKLLIIEFPPRIRAEC